MIVGALVTPHADARIMLRLGDLRADVRLAAVRRAVRYAAEHPTGRHAVRVAKVAMHGSAWSAESNGTDVWAIIRAGAILTVMYRRATQPRGPEAFRVEIVADLVEVD